MRKPIFAICDEDKLYSGKIFEYIHERISESYEVILFTEVDAVERYMKNTKINVLLISEVFRAIIRGTVNAEHVIILTQTFREDEPVRGEVYKYSSADSILKSTMEICSEKKCEPVVRNSRKPLSIIGVYSPIKRAFQTTFSVTLGQILAKKGKTLYLNFECFSGFDLLMATHNKSDLMDLLYFWGLGDENFSYRLGSVIEHIGALDYVPPVHSFAGLNDISASQWLHFLKAFENYTDYEYVILDLSENINGLFDILRMCKTVYSVTDERRISRAKMSQYEALLAECRYDDILDKTKKMNIPMFREIPDEYEMLPYSDLSAYIKRELAFEEKRKEEEHMVG